MTKLYVIGWDPAGPVKVGVSVNPASRVRSLQTGCPYKLRVLATGHVAHKAVLRGYAAREVEAYAHRQLAAKRLEGEWFDMNLDDVLQAFRGSHLVVLQKSNNYRITES